jgi:hypothetical protein
MRDSATAIGTAVASRVSSPRSSADRDCCQASRAQAPSRATAAAVWPDGKLEVGGAMSKCLTGGRGRSTSSVIARKISTSLVTATATSIGSRQRRQVSAAPAAVSAAKAAIVGVLAASVA